MLTRGQVAKRLGKSIATVRRLEGRQLHPRRDAGGILRFEADEVEAFASGVLCEEPEGGRSGWFDAELEERRENHVDHDPPFPTEDFDERVRAAAKELVREEITRRDNEQLGRNNEQLRREAQRRDREEAEARAARMEVVRLLESCSERELAQLAKDPEFSALLDELSAD